MSERAAVVERPAEAHAGGDEAVAGPRGRLQRLRFVRRYVRDVENLWAENAILKLVGVGSLAATLIMAFVVAGQSERTRVIVAPFAGGSPDLLIVGNEPSTEYLSAIARNVVSLTGTFTASSADYQFNEVLKFVHPSVYDHIRDEWKEMVEGLRQYREVSFATYVTPQKPIEVYGDRMRVAARRIRFVGDQVAQESGVVEIGYVVEDGRFWLISVAFAPIGGAAHEQD